jgi:hypothetical protein
MKRLDVVAGLQAELSEENRLAALHAMLEGQMNALERLLENNAAYVKDPGAWNVVAGFIDQLRFYAPRVFYTAETNLDWAQKQEGVPAHPLFGKD